jgi:O-glycosyl hydrolase
MSDYFNQQRAHDQKMENEARSLAYGQLMTYLEMRRQTELMEAHWQAQWEAQQWQAELEARFAIPPKAPIDLRTGLHFPDLAPLQLEQHYKDLSDGLEVAAECNGLATHVVTGEQATYGQIRLAMDMVEHDIELLRGRYENQKRKQTEP